MRTKMLVPLLLAFLCMAQNVCFAKTKAPPKRPPVPVEVVKAKAVEWQPSIESTGTLVAEQGITVAADVAGRVTKIYFKSGEYVQKGAPLVQIYPNILEAQLKSNKAALKLSKLQYQRNKKLILKNAISQSALDESVANLNKDEAMLEQTNAQLNQTLVKASFNGYLGIRAISLGDYLTAGQKIVSLQDTNPMYVDFTVPEVFLAKVHKGQTITITSKAYGDNIFYGKVIAKDSLINPNTRTLGIRASIPNENNVLIPGSFVEVKLYIGKKRTIVSIPQTAIVYSQQGDFVYRVVKGHAVKTLVKLGERGDVNILINQGLKPNAIVVVAGLQKLANNVPVKIISKEK